MGQTMRFKETLRRLAMIDEGFVEDEGRWGSRWPSGRPAVRLEWSAARAMAAGATEDEIADGLLAIAPVAGLSRVVCAAPDVVTALGCDVAAALEVPGGH